MMKKWGKIVTGIFLTAAMLAGILGAGTAQEVVRRQQEARSRLPAVRLS